MKDINSRRKFIKKGGMVSASILGLGLAPMACAPYNFAAFQIEDDRIRISKSEFGKKEYLLIQPEGLSAPVLISKLGEDFYQALLMECTHKQCTVSLAGRALVCPCHGSEFNLQGKVTKSPAEKDLLSFNVSSDESNVYIN